MWISYSDSEVEKYHPICEMAINNALIELKIQDSYEVRHHQKIGPLEMDFAICNKRTGKYLCVVEVKKTPAAVQSTRYQYQAMSYIQMAAMELERPFYIVTNLEYFYNFRFDIERPRAFQQMLKPGLVCVERFSNVNQQDFISKLTTYFASSIQAFIDNTYEYSVTLDLFAEHMNRIKNNHKEWKSSLAILLYEYIRGAFTAVSRKELKDIRVFSDNIKLICDEAARINFEGIFKYDSSKFLSTTNISNLLLTNIFDFGEQNITADTISDVLHGIVSEGKEHLGKVSTDPELARVVALLAKYINNNSNFTGLVCDPAAGSGSLLSSAMQVLGVDLNQVVANDIDEYLIELLTLRLGLISPKEVNKQHSPRVLNRDIIYMEPEDFENVSLVVLNPPYLAGINSTIERQSIAKRIKKLSGNESITNFGQIDLAGVFVELVQNLIKEGTIIACIMPKQYLVARGDEAVAFRRFLLSRFGLELIFNYPGQSLFNAVTKDTCVLIGKKGSCASEVKVVSSIEQVQDIDENRLIKSINERKLNDEYVSIMPGVEALVVEKEVLYANVDNGWRMVNSELCDAINFVQNKIVVQDKMQKFEEGSFELIRGKVGNSGASELLFLNSSTTVYNVAIDKMGKLYPGLKNAKLDSFIVGKGDSVFFNYATLKTEQSLEVILNTYITTQKVAKQQIKKEKSNEELKKILIKEAKNGTGANCVLVPRNLRVSGRVYITKEKTYVSTNFIILDLKNERQANVLGSWMSTIFYQLICEVSSKDQEGTRKMEIKDIEATYIPKILLDDQQYETLKELILNIEFINLQNPVPREIDVFWSKILFGDRWEEILDEATRLLGFVARRRNSKK